MNVKVRSILKLPGYGVYVSAPLLGISKRLVYEGRGLEVTFPGRSDAFQTEGQAFGPTYTTTQPPLGTVIARLIEQLRVDVDYEIDFNLEDFLDASDDFRLRDPIPEAVEVLSQICVEAHDIAERFVAGLCGHIRTTLGQDWLGTSSDVPTFVTYVSVVEATSERELPFHSSKWRSYSEIIGPHEDLTLESLNAIVGDVQAARAPSLARELIYDALYLGRVREPPDLRLAVLSVAIGVEAETMTTLREVCPEPARGLLEHLVASPRDFTMAMAAHLDKTMEAVCGRSLRLENKTLYSGANRLFSVRNAIAHGRGDQPSSMQMIQAVKDGIEVYRWLRSVPASARDADGRSPD